MSTLTSKEAQRAASGWGGDRAYLFERAGSAPLFVWKSLWDDAADAREFFDGYIALGRRKSGYTSTTSAGAKQVSWSNNGRLTLVQLAGDSVIVIRGAEADVNSALGVAQR